LQAQAGARVATHTWWAGIGPSVPTKSVSYRTVALAGLRLGYPIPLPRHHLFPLDSFWEYEIEVPQVFVIVQPASAVAIGGAPIGFRFVTLGHARIRPFIGGLASVLYASRNIPEGASRLNFSPEGEVGVTVGRDPRHSWNVELRYIHISNASIFRHNPGVNGLLFMLGWTR